MGMQKKHGKGRLDKWYKLAKEKGYRARAAFKLIQLNKKYGFLEQSKVLIDLCAAPGSWCQVAAEVMPVNSLIIGVDLTRITPIPRCITFQSDITTDKCRATIRQHLKTWKADTVLHDGAPNVGTAWVQDAYSQAELVLQSLKLATEFLREGGTFVTKVFRSKDYNPLMWVFNQLFSKVEATKPPSSRTVSAEIFVVCRGFKAPKKIDPKFLDPRSVFAELSDPTPNNEAKVFNPEKKKRKREGYEEGDYTQFKEVSAAEFIETADPIAILGSYNRIHFEQRGNGDIALATIDRLSDTSDEVRENCKDLKVLGRKEFKVLLRWRLKVRDIFGISTKKKLEQEKAAEASEVAEVESMDEEMQMQEDLRRMKEKDDKSKRRERRKENDKKQKDIVRMQLNMTAPMDIGMEQAGPNGEDAMFQLKQIDKSGGLSKVAKGKMGVIEEKSKEDSTEEESETDEEEDQLERQLDDMYEDYTERKAAADAKYRAKRARKEHEDGEWGGLSDEEGGNNSSDDELVVDQDSESDEDEDEETEAGMRLTTSLSQEEGTVNGLSKRAAMFFQQDIFKDIEGLDGGIEDDSDSGIDLNDDDDKASDRNNIQTTTDTSSASNRGTLAATRKTDADEEDSDASATFEIVKAPKNDVWEDQPEHLSNGRPDIDIITAEAMTLAQQIASGAKTKHDLMDDGFNKYSLRDTDGLPEWFVDDEAAHSKLLRPITAAGAAAIKEKLRALNARPIKKVREAKARKKFKAAQKLEKLKKKSALLADDEAMSEKDKAGAIAKLMARAAKKKPKQQVKVVVAKGGNRGIKGRPGGTKGRYKMVDARLKKDVRAEKRLKKKMK